VVTPLNRRLRIAATVIVSLAGLVGLAFLATYYYLKPTLPDVAVLRDVRLQVPLRVYSRDGKLLACANRDSGTVSIVELSTHTKLAEIAVGKIAGAVGTYAHLSPAIEARGSPASCNKSAM